MLAKLHELSGTTGWSLHDFRRTFASQLAEFGMPSDVTDALLNHRQAATRPGVIGVYNRSKLMSPKTKAMATWGLMVEHAVATGRFDHDGNVVSLTA